MELRKNSLKRLPRNYQNIGKMRDLRTHHGEYQRTSWTDLKAIDYQGNEEFNIKSLLGIPVERPLKKSPRIEPNTREGLGGGGKVGMRS